MTELRLYDSTGTLREKIVDVTESDSVLADGRKRHDVRQGKALRVSVIRPADVAPTPTPDPTPAPTPTPAPAPTPTAVDKDYTADRSQALGRWAYPVLQCWSDYGVENTDTAQVHIIQSPMHASRKAYEFYLKTGGQRNEFYDASSADVEYTEGEKYWFTNDWWIPSSPNKQAGWYKGSHHSFMQLHAAPPVENTIFGVGVRTSFAGAEGFGAIPAGGGGFERWINEADMYDKKLRVEIYVEFGASGLVKAYLNGVEKFNKRYNTNPSGRVVLKEGMYQSPDQGGNKVVSHGFQRSKERLGA